MQVYEILRHLQGTVIPRFLYAGSIANASYWVIPERGEILAFATTYEGRSLEDMGILSHAAELRGHKIEFVDCSEIAKVDGALTCCSVLLMGK